MNQPIVLIGAGKVGLATAKMLYSRGIRLEAVLFSSGICQSQDMIHEWVVSGKRPTLIIPYHIRQLSQDFPDAIVLDCSGADWDESDWMILLDSGIKAVFCNKSLLGSESSSIFLHPRFKKSVRYEATVSAGLPVIELLQRQLDSGDKITRIRASLSGTMAWLFSELSLGQKFSQALPKAMSFGYTEPDPRDDLSLEDFVRKIRILSRHCGFTETKVQFPKLLPNKAMQQSLPEFLKSLPDYDEAFLKTVSCDTGFCSALVGEIGPDTARLLVESLELQSDFGRIKGCNNLLVIHSHQYDSDPLKISGPGAGVERTAAAVFGDLMMFLSKNHVPSVYLWSGAQLSEPQSVTAYAPASIGNLSCGFDVLGLAVSGLGDTVQACFVGSEGVQLLEITGDQGMLPTSAEKNTVGIVADYLLKRSSHKNRGIGIRLHKGLPLNSGLGSSGASAAAAALAVGALLGDLCKEDYLNACLEAESFVSGRHADNVAASLLGGVIAVTSVDPLNVISIPVSPRVKIGLIQISMEVPTKEARARIPSKFDQKATIANLGSEASLLSSFISENETDLQRGLKDYLVEPFRASMIPALKVLKPAFEDLGLTLCISGAGPTLFFMSYDELKISSALQRTRDIAAAKGIDLQTRICNVDTRGTRVVSAKV